jgi:stage II sporulation protein D
MNKINCKIIVIYLISTIFFLTGINISDKNTRHSDNLPETVSVYLTDFQTISHIPLETYVSIVVANEMPSSFHIEALKAQAVAARTYAVAKIQSDQNSEQHPMAPLCDNTHCQVYNNNKYIHDKIKKAVSETTSELLYYNSQVITDALYHASSGGRTENSEDIFVSAVPYLRSVKSPYEQASQRNGHGVGMSQQSANGMARHGYDYKKILSHFYTNTTVK